MDEERLSKLEAKIAILTQQIASHENALIAIALAAKNTDSAFPKILQCLSAARAVMTYKNEDPFAQRKMEFTEKLSRAMTGDGWNEN